MFVIHVNGAIQISARTGFYPLNPARASYGADTSQAGKSAPPTGLVINGYSYDYLRVHVKVVGAGEQSLVNDPTQSNAARTDTLWAPAAESFSVGRTTVGGMLTCGTTYAGEKNCETPAGPQLSYNAASYTLTGNQTISVERLDPRIKLAAAPSSGGPRTVTFTPTVPAWDGSLQSGGATWRWTPDGGTPQGVACYTASPCTVAVSTSGTMKLTLAFNAHAGVPKLWQTDSIHVDVVNCPTGDSLLDHAFVRQGFAALDSASNPTGPEDSRIEHVAAVVRDPSGMYSLQWLTTDPSGTDNCNSKWGIPPRVLDDGSVIVAFVHTHPYHVNDYAHCQSGDPGTVDPGGSKKDWDALKTVKNNPSYAGHPVPFYVIDSGNIYRMDPDGGYGSDSEPVVANWPSNPSCGWHT